MLTEKVAVVAFAGTITEEGMVKTLVGPDEELELLPDVVPLLTATEAPPAGAGPDKVTVQVLLELGPKVAGLHCTDDTVTAEVARLRVALWEELL